MDFLHHPKRQACRTSRATCAQSALHIKWYKETDFFCMGCSSRDREKNRWRFSHPRWFLQCYEWTHSGKLSPQSVIETFRQTLVIPIFPKSDVAQLCTQLLKITTAEVIHWRDKRNCRFAEITQISANYEHIIQWSFVCHDVQIAVINIWSNRRLPYSEKADYLALVSKELPWLR